MENPNRSELIDELTHKLHEVEKNVANKRTAIKSCLGSRALGTLVRDLRTAMGYKDALEAKLTRLHSPTPLFCLL